MWNLKAVNRVNGGVGIVIGWLPKRLADVIQHNKYKEIELLYFSAIGVIKKTKEDHST